jgi:hypothetical protein
MWQRSVTSSQLLLQPVCFDADKVTDARHAKFDILEALMRR